MGQPRRIQRTPQQKERIRNARQVLAGNAVRPSPDPWTTDNKGLPFTALQRNALLVMLLLLIAGAVLLYLSYTLLATIPLFLLALLLVASRFLF